MTNKIINKNDNNHTRQYLYERPTLARHIPIAHYLIKKFAKGEWKNYPNDLWFIRQEFAICLELENDTYPREWKIHFIAIELECSPLEIFNDPDLPDFK